MRVVVLSACLLAATPAAAAPHGAKAKAEFLRGVHAYEKADYAAASEAFKRSFAAESDVETLFAWAQAERQQDHCSIAIELYRKLDAFNLPAKNREVVVAKRRECEAIVDAQQPPVEPVKIKPQPEPEPPAHVSPKPPPERVIDDPPPTPVVRHRHAASPAWYSDTTGDVLTGVGVVALAIGTGYLIESYKAQSAQTGATDKQYQAEGARSQTDGKVGVTFAVGGAILTAAGIFRFTMLHEPEPAVTAWATQTGGGVAVFGRF